MDFRVGVVVVAAGSGERFGGPKARVVLEGQSLLDRACAPFEGFEDRVAVLAGADLPGGAPPGWRAACGGARRRDSVEAGLRLLAPSTTHVLVHDAARPLADRALVDRVVAALRTHDAVIPGLPVVDTIKRVESGPGVATRVVETPDRGTLVAVQTPQGFLRSLLQRALVGDSADATDEAALVERLGVEVAVVPGSPRNLKITLPGDLALAAFLLRSAAGGDAPFG